MSEEDLQIEDIRERQALKKHYERVYREELAQLFAHLM